MQFGVVVRWSQGSVMYIEGSFSLFQILLLFDQKQLLTKWTFFSSSMVLASFLWEEHLSVQLLAGCAHHCCKFALSNVLQSYWTGFRHFNVISHHKRSCYLFVELEMIVALPYASWKGFLHVGSVTLIWPIGIIGLKNDGVLFFNCSSVDIWKYFSDHKVY